MLVGEARSGGHLSPVFGSQVGPVLMEPGSLFAQTCLIYDMSGGEEENTYARKAGGVDLL